MYLTAVHVAGNVTSLGGGPGTKPSTTGVSFPVKEMTIGGNLTLLGWHGGWIGALRNTVRGNVLIAGNTGNRPGADGPDSTEVLGNTVTHNLICLHNTPAAQYGDAYGAPGNGPNVVHGHAIGECRFLTS